MRLSHLPLRLTTGAFILNSGLSKRGLPEEAAAGMHGMATGSIPAFGNIAPKTFLSGLSAGDRTCARSARTAGWNRPTACCKLSCACSITRRSRSPHPRVTSPSPLCLSSTWMSTLPPPSSGYSTSRTIPGPPSSSRAPPS